MGRSQPNAVSQIGPCLLLLLPVRLAAQSDATPAHCSRFEHLRDSILQVESEPRPEAHRPLEGSWPKDAAGNVVTVHLLVTAAGTVDTSTIEISGTDNAKLIRRVRKAVVGISFEPARYGGCAVDRWTTLTYTSGS
jgi:hypothetical protein